MRRFKHSLIIIAVMFLTGSLFAGSLLEVLSEDNGWVVKETDENGNTLSVKALPNHDFDAVMVSCTTNVEPAIFINLVKSIDRYPEILPSASAMSCRIMERDASGILGYQYLDFPLFSDRHLFFRMHEPPNEADVHMIDWVAIPKDSVEYDYPRDMWMDSTPEYVEYGAGRWIIDVSDDGGYVASYRLYMDLEGYIPTFMINKVNEIGIMNLFNDVIIEANRRHKSKQE